jgi:hypothetical protein
MPPKHGDAQSREALGIRSLTRWRDQRHPDHQHGGIMTQNLFSRKFEGVPPAVLSHTERKSRLIDLGVWAINEQHWAMVEAITAIITRGGLRHE